jgi:hypothetical protein
MAKEKEIDVIAGLPEIAQAAGVSIEGARYLWAQGRLPAVKIGPAWLANKTAIIKAVESGALRKKPGRKPLA